MQFEVLHIEVERGAGIAVLPFENLGAAEDVLGLTLSQVALAAPAPAAPVAPVVAPVVAEPAPVVVEEVVEAPKKPRAAKPAPAPVEAAPAAGPSNDALAAALGL